MGKACFALDKFDLYRSALEYRKRIYSLIKQLPPQESYCLDPQMRRAAVSIRITLPQGMDTGTTRRISSFVVLHMAL